MFFGKKSRCLRTSSVGSKSDICELCLAQNVCGLPINWSYFNGLGSRPELDSVVKELMLPLSISFLFLPFLAITFPA